MNKIMMAALLSLLMGCGGTGAPPVGAEKVLLAVDEFAQPKDNEVLALMHRSYSASVFAEGLVPDEDIILILQAANRAPSAKNAKPWHFSVSRNHELNAALLDAARPGNAVIVISGDPDIETDTLDFDCGLAAQNVQLAAESLGYGCRMYLAPLQSIDKEYRETLGVPKDYKVVIALLIGPAAEGADAGASATPRDPLAGKVTMIE